jgi:hypothetical protein
MNPDRLQRDGWRVLAAGLVMVGVVQVVAWLIG